jgi:hypothetical protein
MEAYLITGEYFKKRVVDLFVRSGSQEFPTKRRDQLIVLKSIVLALETQKNYSEAEVNDHIKSWLKKVNNFSGWDHITLRRRLIDAKLLIRTPDGSSYQLDPDGPVGINFEPVIAGFDFYEIITAAKQSSALKKAAYQQARTLAQ